MTKEEIIEGNELIAKFMQLQIKSMAVGMPEVVYLCKNSEGFDEWINEYMLRYHSSWDWLMPVVEKIKESYWITITSNPRITAAAIRTTKLPYSTIIKTESINEITAVYEMVVGFIKWYNKNN